MKNKNDNAFNGKWAIVTKHPWLPSVQEQIARARAWGLYGQWLDKLDTGPIVIDDASNVPRTTKWQNHLPGRRDFIEKIADKVHDDAFDNQVFFADPLCVGISQGLAEWTIRGLWDAGFGVYVHTVRDSGAALYVKGDKLEEILACVDAMANAKHQAKHVAKVRAAERFKKKS